MQLKVKKADGNYERYLHTKIIGTINSALGAAGRADARTAEEFADIVTYYLHNKYSKQLTSSEILSVIKAVLTSTGYEDAAIALSEHNFERRLKRSRIQVLLIKAHQATDPVTFCKEQHRYNRTGWDKSVIVEDLVNKNNISRQNARIMAGLVEEKILKMEVSQVSTGLIKQLVLTEATGVLHAEKTMQNT